VLIEPWILDYYILSIKYKNLVVLMARFLVQIVNNTMACNMLYIIASTTLLFYENTHLKNTISRTWLQ
jgi:hypothetical protein